MDEPTDLIIDLLRASLLMGFYFCLFQFLKNYMQYRQPKQKEKQQ